MIGAFNKTDDLGLSRKISPVLEFLGLSEEG
jgi:hypothetical protein